MPDLSVPSPDTAFEAPFPETTPPLTALLEKPVEVHCVGAFYPDAAPFQPQSLGQAGFFVYRQSYNAAAMEIWDEDGKQWLPDPGGALNGLKPKAFAYKEGEPFPWQSVLVAAGQKDASGADQFEKSNGGYPRYFFRAYFANDPDRDIFGEQWSGLSTPSLAHVFLGSKDMQKAGLKVGPFDDATPENAGEITLFMKNGALEEAGQVVIRDMGNGTEIVIYNANYPDEYSHTVTPNARIYLTTGGFIEIQPGPGASVIINGPVQCGQIYYQPSDASGNPTGSPRWLA
jgi:hypothetical protein